MYFPFPFSKNKKHLNYSAMYKTIRQLALLFIILLAIIPLQAQVEKGMSLIDLNSQLGTGSTYFRSNIEADMTILKAISEKWMIGASFAYVKEQPRLYANQEITRQDVYRLSPTARYYFSQSRLSPFVSAANHITIAKDDNEAKFDKWGSALELGLGVTYFIAKDVAIEALARGETLQFGESINFDRQINLDFKVRYFIGNSDGKRIEDLPSSIYRKGVLSSSAQLTYQRYLDTNNRGHYRIAPDIDYFLSDRLSVSAMINIEGHRTKDYVSDNKSFGLGLTRYFQLSKKTFFNAGINGTHTSRSWVIDPAQKNVLNLTVQGELSRFSGPTRIFGGYRYSYLDFVGEAANSPNRLNEAVYAGADYFLSKNVFLRGRLDVNLSKNNENYIGIGSSAALRLGIGFNLAQ